MSERHSQVIEGRATVVAKTPARTFAERFVAAGFNLPDQATMKHMMLAAAHSLPWDATGWQVSRNRWRFWQKQTFKVRSLEEYAALSDNHWGAPVPSDVLDRIKAVQERFPGVQTRIHALRKDDPFVEHILDGENLFTQAWIRSNGKVSQIYPK